MPSGLMSRTYWTLATHRKKQIAAAKPLLKICAAARARPLSRVWIGESARRRRSRAATAPPSMPTIRHRCWTMALEPEMSLRKTRRRMISATGRSSMAASANTSKRFSASPAQRQRPACGAGSEATGGSGVAGALTLTELAPVAAPRENAAVR